MSGPFTEGGFIRPLAGPKPPSYRYPLDNDDRLAAQHHECLSWLLDPISQLRTSQLFETDLGLYGRRCLEVGAGIGARYAHWLADQVGDGGCVVATDIKPRHILKHPHLSVVRCDLTSEDADLGEGWDFIHARLTLAHLPQRRDLLTRLITALAPGGQLLVEDWDTSRTNMILSAPDLHAAERCTMLQETIGRLFATAGTDRAWARRIHAAMLTDGLAEVHTSIHAESWTGGGTGTRLVSLLIDELRPALLATGFSDSQLDQVQYLLTDPSLVLAGHLLYSTSGSKPDQ